METRGGETGLESRTSGRTEGKVGRTRGYGKGWRLRNMNVEVTNPSKGQVSERRRINRRSRIEFVLKVPLGRAYKGRVG